VEELPYFNFIEAQSTKNSLSIQINPAALFKKIANVAITDYMTAGAGTSLTIIRETLTFSYHSSDGANRRVFKLFSNALSRAFLYNVIPYRSKRKGEAFPHEAKALNQTIHQDLVAVKLVLNADLLTKFKVEKIEGLDQLFDNYQQWLQNVLQLDRATATAIRRTTKERLIDFLDIEWVNKPSYYGAITQYLNTPFSEARLAQGRKKAYYEELKQRIYTPLFVDAQLTLKELYVQPYFNVYNQQKISQPQEEYFDPPTNYKGDLHEYLRARFIQNQYSLKEDTQQRLLFLLGQPGQGKSSFCSYFIHELLEQNYKGNIYFVRLRDIEKPKELIEHPFEVLQNYWKDFHDIALDWKASNLLILDGLDELYMSNGLTKAQLKDFYHQLQTRTRQRTNLQILLTSRLHYLRLGDIGVQDTLVLRLAPFSLEQQQTWLRNYQQVHSNSSLTAQQLATIDEVEALTPLKELVELPILLYLIVKANIDIDQQAQLDRASIYEQLFDSVLNRSWAERQIETFRKFKTTEAAKQAFRTWLQELAFNIHQSAHLYLRIEELLEMPTTQALLTHLDTSDELEEAAKNLLITFYFKKTTVATSNNKNNNQALEFLHKSLQEYLVVEHCWTTIQQQLLAQKDEAYVIKEGEAALQLFWKLFAVKGFNNNMIGLLEERIAQTSLARRQQVRARMRGFLGFCLKRQFLDLSDKSATIIKEKKLPPIDAAMSIFYHYWFVLVRLEVAANKNLIEEESKVTFCKLLKYNDRSVGLSLDNLSLRGANLRGANLRSADLRGVDLRGADLSVADLSRANLIGADLIDADLNGAYLIGANLNGANLSRTYLIGADLSGANLIGANLIDADLSGADLIDADLSNANLIDADLRNANLLGANLSQANVENAIVNTPNFFQQLKKQHCEGVAELMKKYKVDPTPQYHDGDTEKKYKHYRIIRRGTKSFFSKK
jgi:uncharacterized protein YjbI with pentapeptide repeats/GTPase SAR1 family protein